MNGFFRRMLKLSDRFYHLWMEKRESEYRFPEAVEAVYDLPYREDGLECHKFDMFLPRKREKKLPVILNFHGGGLVMCTRHMNRPFCAELAMNGYAVFGIDYPLVPERDACGILADVCEAMRYVDSVLERYGCDRDNVFVTGDSAGAFLAVYAEAARKNPEIARAAGVTPAGLEIRAMGLISGMFDTVLCDDPGLVMRREFYGKNWRSHPMLPYLRPSCPAVASAMPPVMLVTAKFDKLRRATMRFARGLREAGTEVQVLDFPARPMIRHDFVVLAPEKGPGKDAVEQMVQFMHRFAKNGD